MPYIAKKIISWGGKTCQPGDLLPGFENAPNPRAALRFNEVAFIDDVVEQESPASEVSLVFDATPVKEEKQEDKCHFFDEFSKVSDLKSILADHGVQLQQFVKKEKLFEMVAEVCK